MMQIECFRANKKGVQTLANASPSAYEQYIMTKALNGVDKTEKIGLQLASMTTNRLILILIQYLGPQTPRRME